MQAKEDILSNFPNIKLSYENGCFMINAATEMCINCDETTNIVVTNKKQIEDTLTSWIDEAQREGVLKLSKPAKAYGSFLFNSLCGLKVMIQSGAGKTELNNVLKITMDALV